MPLFLISLKAGGTGLNLTAADTVIHYDPWWNPAVENQATDRAHRIGQDKPVFVYKLIVAGSVEEKIAQLQAKKAALAAGVLGRRRRSRRAAHARGHRRRCSSRWGEARRQDRQSFREHCEPSSADATVRSMGHDRRSLLVPGRVPRT